MFEGLQVFPLECLHRFVYFDFHHMLQWLLRPHSLLFLYFCIKPVSVVCYIQTTSSCFFLDCSADEHTTYPSCLERWFSDYFMPFGISNIALSHCNARKNRPILRQHFISSNNKCIFLQAHHTRYTWALKCRIWTHTLICFFHSEPIIASMLLTVIYVQSIRASSSLNSAFDIPFSVCLFTGRKSMKGSSTV